MASLLSVTANSLSFPSTPFKGNVKTLMPKPPSSLCVPLKVQQRNKPPQLTVLNQAASASASATVGSGPVTNVRFRLNNLGPQPGSRKRGKRKGRGIAAGQGNSCGFGMRGQKSRSGPGVRKGFEGGQMPLYRRIPKLRGIAGGMHAGLPKYVPVNLKDIEAAGFLEGDEVSLETLKKKGLINPSGRERKLPLKLVVEPDFCRTLSALLKCMNGSLSIYASSSDCQVKMNYAILGDGELSKKLNFKARAFSTSAKEKLEAAGCTLTVLPGRKKWVKPSVAKNLARAEEYFAKKRAAAAASDSTSA
ncbi:hypothetical protein WN943_011850 [Citrus x changshan-huyou]